MIDSESNSGSEEFRSSNESLDLQSELDNRMPDLLQEGEELISSKLVLTDEALAIYQQESLSVLKMLEQLYPDEAVLPYAGISLNPEAQESQNVYRAGFGRDTLIALSFLLDKSPESQPQPLIAKGLQKLAAMQGVKANSVSEEEPGKIIHEFREAGDPHRKALEAEGWDFPYYGSIDSTPLFINSAVSYIEKCDSSFAEELIVSEIDGSSKTIRQAIADAAEFLQSKIATSQRGLVEFYNPNDFGNKAQNWTDSPQAFHHDNGEIANFDKPIAAIEVQAISYDALISAARILPDQKTELLQAASELREKTIDEFWIPEKGFLAMGLDYDPVSNQSRRIETSRSSAGWLLDSEILQSQPNDSPEDFRRLQEITESTIEKLFASDMMHDYGIRTVSTESPFYRETQYHNGCIWAFDSTIIARGLEKHGYFGLARNLNNRILQAITKLGFLPEFHNSSSDSQPEINRWDIEVRRRDGLKIHAASPPKEIQLWTASAIARIKHLNGLDALPSEHRHPMPLEASDPQKKALELKILSSL